MNGETDTNSAAGWVQSIQPPRPRGEPRTTTGVISMSATPSVPGEASPANPEICPTHANQRITRVLSACDTYRLFGLVIGEPGTGKTSAAESYAASTSHGDATYCRMGQSAHNTRTGLGQIASALGMRLDGASEDDAQKAIAYHLRYSDSPFIILDEAQRMSDGLLEHVRDFYDTQGIGVVLVGNRGLVDRWTGRRNGRSHDFGQLRGRFGPQVDMKKVLADDVTTIARHHGITDAASTKVLKHAAGLPGGLHNVAQVLTIARALQGDDKPPSAESLRAAAVLTEVA